MTSVIENRFKWIVYTFVLLAIGVVLRILFLLVNPSAIELKEHYIDNYEYTTMQINTERGNIYDRSGYLLAGNTISYEISLDLDHSKENPDFIAEYMAPILSMSYEEVFDIANYKNLEENKDKTIRQMPLTKYASKEIVDQIQLTKAQLSLRKQTGIEARTEKLPDLDSVSWAQNVHRYYPDGDLAYNIIGFFPYMNPSAGASYGIEEYYDSILAAETVSTRYSLNPNITDNYPDLPKGASVVLTIDRKIQKICEDIIEKAVTNNKAISGTVLISNPKTGEIIAMASYPSINLNEYWQSATAFDETHLYNPAVMQPFEVGSVFKVITLAAGIDSGVITPTSTFNDTGVHMVMGVPIYNWDRGAWGPQTMLGCMQHSLNTCLAWISEQIGTERFYEYLDAFGLDDPTGIELADEEYYPIWKPGSTPWTEINLRTNSYGQGLSTTPIQLVTAIGAIANQGKMMKPHIVKAIYADNYEEITKPEEIGQPISAETAKTVTEMMGTSIEVEASDASMQNIRIAGKTGTGEISHGAEGYIGNLTNASFIGWGPVDDPQFVTYVWLQEPQTNIWGSKVAAPLFGEVMEAVAPYMHLPEDRIRQCLYTEVCPTQEPDEESYW